MRGATEDNLDNLENWENRARKEGKQQNRAVARIGSGEMGGTGWMGVLRARASGMLGGGLRSELRTELEWQARWFSGELGRDWVSSEGERVRVVQFGVWNRGAGPDFLEVAISVDGGPPRRGAIELDGRAEDWERHGHGQNWDYAGVVLHVVIRRGGGPLGFTRTVENRRVPRVYLDPEPVGLEEGRRARFEGEVCNGSAGSVVSAAPPLHRDRVLVGMGRCARAMGELSEERLLRWLREAAGRRFARKVEGLRRGAEAHGLSGALFQAVAAGLGYRGNELPFRLLAQRLPVGELQAAGDLAEGWVYGVAGWMSPIMLPINRGRLSGEAREYVRWLWEGWWRHRGEGGRTPLDPELWRLGRQRPGNHPQRRLAVLVGLVRQWPRLVRMCRTREWPGIRRILLELRHPFWSWHWTLRSRRMGRCCRLLGTERVEDLLWNAFFPAAGDWSVLECDAGGRSKAGNGRCRVAAGRLLPGVKGGKSWLRRPLYQQGLMEWYESVCHREDTDCERCGFPEWLEAIGRSNHGSTGRWL